MDYSDFKGILGITGRAKSGKDVASAELIKGGWKRVKMADPLKDMLRCFYKLAGLDEKTIERKIEGDLKEEPCEILCGKTPRFAMQTLGTEWGREIIGNDVWANIGANKAQQELKNGFNVVVDDVRFDNEAAALRELGGTICQVNREGSGIKGNHSSEKGCSFDMKVENNSTVEAFLDKIRHIFIKKD